MICWMDLFVKPLVKHGIRFAGSAAGLGIIANPLSDYVVDVWEGFSKQKNAKDVPPVPAALQKLADGSDEVGEQIDQSIQRVAGDQPPQVRQWMKTYLKQVPGAVRRSLRRLDDPTGRTIPPGLNLQKPHDLLRFLPRMPRFKPGDRPLLSTDLELRELLGIGGFGEVWKANHTDRPDSLPVALKFCTDAAAAANLRQEVSLLDRVKDQGTGQSATEDGIVKLIYAHLRADPPCLEYEFVGDGDLTRYISELHRLGAATPDRVARTLYRLARIVGQAHRQHPPIVHRDLKPDNILLQHGAGGYCFKVMDFGIGGIVAEKGIEQWRTSQTCGDVLAGAAYTPQYASRQQRQGEKADTRDDVYALGVIWYQMVTGNLLSEPPRGGGWKKRLVDKGMAPPLVELLEQCLEDEPADRPANAQVLADRLEAAWSVEADVPVAVEVIPEAAAVGDGAPKRNRAAEIHALRKKIDELSGSPAKEGLLAWHKRKFGSIPIVGQIFMWFLYGFVWIPIYYLIWGKVEQWRREQSRSMGQEIEMLQERLQSLS